MPSVFGGIGRLEVAPFNNPDDQFPTWLDITPLVRAEETALSLTRGRQTELDSIQSSQLTCILDNSDNRFTPGYTGGPYGANWTTGKPVRYSETIGERTFYLFTGFLEFPDVDDWRPIGYQEVNLTAVDRLTRLARTPAYVSTLGAYIQFNAPSLGGLYYWPLNQAAAPFPEATNAAANPNLPIGTEMRAGVTGSASGTLYKPNGATPIIADDLTGLQLTPLISGGLIYRAAFLQNGNVSVTANSTTLTFAWWQWFDFTQTADDIFMVNVAGPSLGLQMSRSSGTWQVFGTAASSSVSFNINTLPGQRWTYLALRMTLPSGLVEFFQDDQPVQSGTMSGSPPTSVTAATIGIGDGFAGYLAHVQMYVGSTYTAAAHTAQFRAGLLGLEYQTTGQRVSTILDYAGVPSGLRAIDPGSSFVTRATLSGTTAKNQLDLATVTEQSRLFIDGQGRVVFHGRERVYNV